MTFIRRDGEIVVKCIALLAEDLGLISGTYTGGSQPVTRVPDLKPSSDFLRHQAHKQCTCIHANKAFTHIKNINPLNFIKFHM